MLLIWVIFTEAEQLSPKLPELVSMTGQFYFYIAHNKVSIKIGTYREKERERAEHVTRSKYLLDFFAQKVSLNLAGQLGKYMDTFSSTFYWTFYCWQWMQYLNSCYLYRTRAVD